jgi:carbon monoxide dehydrogenase subunit G
MLFKRIFFIFSISFLFYSCVNSIDGNKNVIKEERVIPSFNKIDISGEFEVLITQNNTEKLELEVDDNLVELIESKVENNTLYISSKESIGSAKSLKLYISIKNIDAIDISGAIELKNKGTITVDHLTIDASGAADIKLDIETESLTIDVSGASETTLAGKTNNFDIELSGASELDAKKLKSQNISIDISGAGSAVVFAKKTLNVSVSGAGSIQYKGNPKITKDISGAGSISKL